MLLTGHPLRGEAKVGGATGDLLEHNNTLFYLPRVRAARAWRGALFSDGRLLVEAWGASRNARMVPAL